MTVIILDSYGTSVRLKSRQLEITKTVKTEDGEKFKSKSMYAIAILSGLVVSNRVYVSIPALMALMRNGIPVLWMERNTITGVSHPFHSHGTVIVRRQQFEAVENGKGMELMKGFVKSGIINKSRLLKMYARNRRVEQPETSHFLEEAAFTMMDQLAELESIEGKPGEKRHEIMGIEGSATRTYYSGLGKIIPEQYGYNGRTKRSPKDPVNSALSYGYMILNARAYMCCCMTGLDPYGGFLHVDRSGRPSLSIDLAEEFRQAIVDRAVMKLVTKKMLDVEEDFEQRDGGVFLKGEGKQLVIEEINERMQGNSKPSSGEQVTYESAILKQARTIARYLMGKTSQYQPFLMEW